MEGNEAPVFAGGNPGAFAGGIRAGSGDFPLKGAHVYNLMLLKIPEEAARARAIKPGPFYWLIGEQAAGCYARA